MGTAGCSRGGSFLLWGVMRSGVMDEGEDEFDVSIFSGDLFLLTRRMILIFFTLSPVLGRLLPLRIESTSVEDSVTDTGCGTVWASARIGPSSLQK